MPFGPEAGPWCDYCGWLDDIDGEHLRNCPVAAFKDKMCIDWPMDEERERE